MLNNISHVSHGWLFCVRYIYISNPGHTQPTIRYRVVKIDITISCYGLTLNGNNAIAEKLTLGNEWVIRYWYGMQLFAPNLNWCCSANCCLYRRNDLTTTVKNFLFGFSSSHTQTTLVLFITMNAVGLFILLVHSRLSAREYMLWVCHLLKGLRMVARALWRSEARRVVPWSETLHEP